MSAKTKADATIAAMGDDNEEYEEKEEDSVEDEEVVAASSLVADDDDDDEQRAADERELSALDPSTVLKPVFAPASHDETSVCFPFVFFVFFILLHTSLLSFSDVYFYIFHLFLNQSGKEVRKVSVPQHRMAPLKKCWVSLYTPIVSQLHLQIRMNTKTNQVEIQVGWFL